MSRSYLAAMFLAWLAICDTGRAQENGAPKPARLDAHGDPLPKGAITRFGTTRLGNMGGVYGLAFSPNGKWVASKNDSGIVRLWDVASGKLVRALKSPSHGRGPFAFAPDGKTLASATEKLVCFWEPDTGRLMRQLEGHDRLTSIAFSPNNQLLATGGFEGAIVLWDALAGKVLHTLKGHRDGPTGLVFTPDNKTLASTGYDGTTRLWDVIAGKELFKFAPNKLSNSALLISTDGKTLISTSHDGIIRYFDVADRREVRQIKADKHLWSLALSKDGKLLAAGGSDGVIRLYDAHTAAPLGTLPAQSNQIGAIALSPDGETIAWGAGYRIHVGKFSGLPKNVKFKELFPHGGHEMGLDFVGFSPDGKKILSTSNTDGAILWGELSGKELHRFRDGPLAAWSRDGKLLALADASDPERRAVLLCDAGTGAVVGLASAPRAVVSIEFSVDRASLIVACSDGAVYLLETATGQVRVRLPGKASPFWRAVLAPDGLTIATTGADVRLWDAISGAQLAKMPLAVSFGPLVFSPDGKTLACCDFKDKAVVFWDLGKQKEIRRIDVLAYSLAFTPDGQTLAGACQDLSIRLWDVASGKQRHEFRGHDAWIRSIAISGDGRTLVSGSMDTTLLLWPLDPFVKGKRIGPARLPAPEMQARLARLPPAPWEQCWRELAEPDAPKAYRAMWGLVAQPKKTLPAVRKWADELGASPSLERLLADLGHDDFARREEAEKTLKRLGRLIEPALRSALTGKPPTEVKRRIERLLGEHATAVVPNPEIKGLRAQRAALASKMPADVLRRFDWLLAQKEAALVPGPHEHLRLLRAIEALEHIGSAEARTVLGTLAKQSVVVEPAQRAKAALERLAQSGADAP